MGAKCRQQSYFDVYKIRRQSETGAEARRAPKPDGHQDGVVNVCLLANSLHDIQQSYCMIFIKCLLIVK
uniref:Uncharacterized protein n=1 Tax=Romanomermis culicivorax TaxID=13658 RepID=A0A915JSY6_ROMCU